MMPASKNRTPNELIHETSPYLLQHAYNPVKWLPFGKAAFEKAERENKLVLISVGYSACHWCHVMEHESFEDEDVAALMNQHFVCVKVDREERADVDMLYMQAVQLMTGQGGWPMNCFVLPDGRPCYGGTYFNKEQWVRVLQALADLNEKQPEKIRAYADELTGGIRRIEEHISSADTSTPVTREGIAVAVDQWRKRFDNTEGGPDHAPKFPMPANYVFLLRYAQLTGDNKVMAHVELTLTKMALGGINDQVHGGFARYSTDMIWKVPHFEKMLYDNAQLASLYLEAYAYTKNPLYSEVAKQILAFVKREWLSPEGGFYSAFDADSEGEEGKYYVWTKEELEDVLGEDYAAFSRYFLINEQGYWEQGNYVLMRNPEISGALVSLNMNRQQMAELIERSLEKLRRIAKGRVKPGLDDKVITSWNALMCTAFAKAYLVLGKDEYKATALSSARFMRNNLFARSGHLMRTYKNGNARINAFLDDYAFLGEALINCYLITQDLTFLGEARSLTNTALDLFKNERSDFLYYTSSESEPLVTRNTETSDNVIPSSNAQMAFNLFHLGHYFGKQEWIVRSEKMLSGLSDELYKHAPAYGHWAALALEMAFPFREAAIVGKDVDEKLRAIYREGVTNTIFVVSAGPCDLPLLKDRFVRDKTMIYVCENKTCGLPIESVNEAVERLG